MASWYKQAMTESDREQLIRQYAAGEITWHALRERGFDNYVQVPHGWLSETVEAYSGGKLIQKEEYSDINTDAKVAPSIFVPPAPKH